MTVAYPTSFGRNIVARSRRSRSRGSPTTPDEEEHDDRDIMRSSNRSASRGRECRAYPLITPVILTWLGRW